MTFKNSGGSGHGDRQDMNLMPGTDAWKRNMMAAHGVDADQIARTMEGKSGNLKKKEFAPDPDDVTAEKRARDYAGLAKGMEEARIRQGAMDDVAVRSDIYENANEDMIASVTKDLRKAAAATPSRIDDREVEAYLASLGKADRGAVGIRRKSRLDAGFDIQEEKQSDAGQLEF